MILIYIKTKKYIFSKFKFVAKIKVKALTVKPNNEEKQFISLI